MKATLGIGFEDRSPALDFNIALAEIRKVLGADGADGAASTSGRGGAGKGKGMEETSKQDFSLKEGQKIHIQVGSKGRRSSPGVASTGQDENTALFSIAPPPAAAKAHNDFPSIAPPSGVEGKSAQELGFDDGEFGEFQ
jgi:hypothetical protein